MKSHSRRQERRAADRPLVGDTRPCPACADGMLEFTERFRASRSDNESTQPMPAWVCDQCPHLMFVRKEHQPAAVRAHARATRALANQNIMKARFVRGRADRALQKSLNRKKRR